jgi:hypothetical protein
MPVRGTGADRRRRPRFGAGHPALLPAQLPAAHRRPTDLALAHQVPRIRRHFRAALRRGWPRTLVLNRPGANDRRDKLLERYTTRDGFDRDEYPPAVGRGKGEGLERGRNRRGWKADVRDVPSAENRSHGSVLGLKLRRFFDGTRFR